MAALMGSIMVVEMGCLLGLEMMVHQDHKDQRSI